MGERKRSIHTEAMAALYHALGASRILDDRTLEVALLSLGRGLGRSKTWAFLLTRERYARDHD